MSTAAITDYKTGWDVRYVEQITGHVQADALEAAALIIEERGWHRGGPFGDDGSLCVGMAIRAACGIGGLEETDPWADSLREAVTESVMDRVPAVWGYKSIPYWNDSRCHDQQEAVDTLRAVAKSLRDDESPSPQKEVYA